MSAAELKFTDPEPKQPQWLALAQAVFNNQANRWDPHCGGGLRWQFNPLNNGFDMKNTISNGGFFQLAARLSRYTHNETYGQWANKAYDWMASSILISDKYEVFDSFHFTEKSCDTKPDPVQWSYNIGTIIAGSAFVSFAPRLAREFYKVKTLTHATDVQPSRSPQAPVKYIPTSSS
jgi:mannan endo-1,6-alpha-mannosidase